MIIYATLAVENLKAVDFPDTPSLRHPDTVSFMMSIFMYLDE
jgi:hypothetical protein